jgi:hypothetical protein
MDRQELSDAVWERISPHLPGKVTDPGRSGREKWAICGSYSVAGPVGCALAGSTEGVWSVAHRLPAL